MDQSSRNDQASGLEERLEAYLSSPVIKRSVMISGHATSVSIEKPFWDELSQLANTREISINALITEIDNMRGEINLSSALRLYVLHSLK